MVFFLAEHAPHPHDVWKEGFMFGIAAASVVVLALVTALGIMWRKLNSKSREYGQLLMKVQEARVTDNKEMREKLEAIIMASEKVLKFIGDQVRRGNGGAP